MIPLAIQAQVDALRAAGAPQSAIDAVMLQAYNPEVQAAIRPPKPPMPTSTKVLLGLGAAFVGYTLLLKK